jgi:putative membrane protein
MTTLPLTLADTLTMHDWGAGSWVAMMIGMLIFWALLIVGVVWVIHEVGGDRSSMQPLEVLKRRLAEGEISADEYERRRTLLDDH